jgi:hypothetical protein
MRQAPVRWRACLPAACGARRATFARVLKRLPEHKTDYELQEVVVELEDIACEGSTGDDVFGGCSTLCEWFNAVLSNLYDWADAERIWIGGKPR